MEELSFLKLLRKGDEIAYKKLYKEYYNTLCNYVFQLCENKKLSEDIVQDTLLNFYLKRKKININKSLKNYLIKSSYHQFLQYLRKNNIEFDILDKVKWENISQIDDSQEDVKKQKIRLIYDLIEKLPTKCRQVFIKSKIEGLKYKEIACEMNISTKTVENQMSKALIFLRENANL